LGKVDTTRLRAGTHLEVCEMAKCRKTTVQIEAYSLNGKMTHAKWCEVASHLTACEVASEKPVKASKKSTTPSDHPGKGCKAAHPEFGLRHRAWKIAKSTAEKQSRAKKSKSRKTSTTRAKASQKPRSQRIVEDNVDGPVGVYSVDSPSSTDKLLKELTEAVVASQTQQSESLVSLSNSLESLAVLLVEARS
jgi:hypothetical protein